MSCEEFERHIFLYEELSPSEKNLLDKHLQTCASCAALFEGVKGTQLLVKQITDAEIVPQNAARLTSGIMSKIAAEKTDRSDVFLLSLFGRARVVLTVLSIVLLVSFAFEFLRDPTRIQRVQSLTGNTSTVLNSKIFRDNFSQGKVKHSLFADCGTPLKMGQGYLDCLRSKLK